MPPLPSQKGTGKKGRDVRQSRSRNTTPSLSGTLSTAIPQTDAPETSYLELPVASFRTASEDILEQYGSAIPNSKELESLMERLQKVMDAVESRGSVCDRGMRLLAQLRKDRLEEIESDRRRDEERKENLKRDAADEEERDRKANKIKKRKDGGKGREERPSSHGARASAPQDVSHLPDQSSPIRETVVRKPRKLSRDLDSASSSLSPVAPATPTATGMDIDDKNGVAKSEDSSSEEEEPPAPAAPHHQTFGDDPSTFPDPTVYEIREVKPGLSEDEIKEIYSVAQYPHNDLSDLIPGTPPDKDFSNAKPTNQVQFNTFSTYIEPYFRPLTEEDLAFLRDRGDRTTPFVIPRRGKKHYSEIWAEEDGAMAVDAQARDKLQANQARGSIDTMNDDVAETDQISAGPILSRLLATLRPEHRAGQSEEKPTTNGVTNGEVNVNGESNNDTNADLNALMPDAPAPIPPATFMTDSSSESWKKATHPKLDHAQVDERIKQELRHIGFLPPDTEPDYDAHYDDEVAARLRFLQTKLKEQSIINGARKTRLAELAKEHMAHQEYTTILEDLDGQVQTAYLKRTRTLGKSKKTKRPGGAGGGSHFVGTAGMARPGIGDMTKTLMERRHKWIDSIGMVFNNEGSLGKVPRSKDAGSSIFKPEIMGELVKKEKEGWDEEAEDE
ncbi:hypothetical protein B7463_g10592, partial [Scytalidium lignicola]